ncbi:MAG: hypothetical protein Q9166_002557 [cf. Caloplaca sp. 2 TL-2023]
MADGSLGIEGSDYHTVLARDLNVTPKYIVTGTAGCMASNRLSYFYNLSGPSVTVDTACSSSMAALHQAVRTLQHHDSTMALVCGANLVFNPETFVSMTELGFLSASGRCRSFDAGADGYGRGEDPIRAVIKGTRLNQDGRTQGITLPSADAQAKNMSSLYKELMIDPETIQYLEAHGTGTAVGDPLEIEAAKEVFDTDKHPLIVGSVKGNVGHCEAASALVGLIKTVLCIEYEQIPAQMHFNTPNPKISFINSHITIPIRTLPWSGSSGSWARRRAAINTFGAGGTNGHAVLESYLSPPSLALNEASSVERSLLFKVSAADETALQDLSKSYATYVDEQRPNLTDLAHTLLACRSSLRFSRFFVVSNHDSLLAQLRSNDATVVTKGANRIGKVLFVFTGQGAQW